MTLVSAARVVVVGVSGCAVVVSASLDEQHEQHEQHKLHKWHKPIITAIITVMMVEATQPPTGTATATIFLIALPNEESKIIH